jgi:CubicO group peptidase (beta-lactamase class C family)
MLVPMTAPNLHPGNDFSALHAAMQRWVDADFLAGVSVGLVTTNGAEHLHCTGWADREGGIALRADHLFRIYSNTKLVTSCAVLLLLEEGRFALDDAIERYLPALAQRRVLRPGARTIADTVPARGSITIAQLLSHQAGLSYGLFDPGTPLAQAYEQHLVNSPDTTLAQMVDELGALPLKYEPGTQWEYSIATDVLARLVEVVSGMPFDRFLHERIFAPLDMRDTSFVVPEAARARLAALYVGHLTQPGKPGLQRAEHLLPEGSHLRAQPRLNGGGGLVSTLTDMLKLLRSLLPGSGQAPLLQAHTLAAMRSNQLPEGRFVRFMGQPVLTGRAHGLASGLVLTPGVQDHPDAAGELYWGGVAATQWWISPRHGFAGALMTQRWWGYGHPLFAELKREAYVAMLGTAGRALATH